MKHLSVTLIVLALIAADFGASALHLPRSTDWATADTIGLAFAGYYFWSTRKA